MVKKKSPKEIIESTDHLEEHAYVRIPGKEMIDVSKKSSRDKVDINQEKVESVLKDYPGKYSSLHEHTSAPKGKEEWGYVATPSGGDLGYFLSEKYGAKQEAMHIAQRDGDTGKVYGYITLRKTKKTNLIPGEKNPFFGYDLARSIADMDEGDEANKLLDKIIKDYKLQIRYTPAKGFEYDSKKLKFVKKKSLEQKVSLFVSIGGLFSSLFFLGFSLTGNSIGSLDKSSSSWIGLILFLLGITGLFFWFRNK